MGETHLDLDARVLGSPERNSGISWPLAVDKRLDDLLEFARDLGERTTRKELVAAILVAFEADEERLAEILRNYRRATIRNVVMRDGEDSEGSVTFIPNRSGPRPVGGALGGES